MKSLLQFAKFTPELITLLYQRMGNYPSEEKDGKEIRLKALSVIEDTDGCRVDGAGLYRHGRLD